MPLNVEAEWSKPIDLKLSKAGAIYETALERIPEDPGIYVFGRTHGDYVSPLYVGRAENLRRRIAQQFNSVRLMTSIRDAERGARFLIYCVPSIKPGQQAKRVIRIMEDTLIAHALSEGFELMQKQGLKRPSHTFTFWGNRTSEAIAPRFMRLRA